MFQTSLILCGIGFILMQLIFINLVTGEDPTLYDNSTNYAAQWKSGRSKRSLENMPNILDIQVKYDTDELIELLWVKRTHHIANQHLPVIMTSGYLNPNVMEDVGEFAVYYDIQKCSSAVYFKKLNVWFGNIGLRYFISNLPNKFDENGKYPEIAGVPFIIKHAKSPDLLHPLRHHMDMQEDVLEPSNDDLNGGRKRQLDSDSGPSSKYQRQNRDLDDNNYVETTNANVSEMVNIRRRRQSRDLRNYYLETLVLVTSEIAEIFKRSSGADNYIAWTVRYCIIYFASIDMIFSKAEIGAFKLYINIAKIVIEDVSRDSLYVSSNGELQFTETVEKLKAYLSTRRNVHPRDSFDHVLMITSLPIKVDSFLADAASSYDADLYAWRKMGQFHDKFPVTLVGYKTDHVTTVYEISRTLGIQNDPQVGGSEDSVQCSSIMQGGGSRCDNCVKWSVNSKEQFTEFFVHSRNRCFLLNKPRSLQPPGPSPFLSPYIQCICFGYVSSLQKGFGVPRDQISIDACNKPLQCMKKDGDQSYYENTILPFDGTRCGKLKVCWDGECVPAKRKYCIN